MVLTFAIKSADFKKLIIASKKVIQQQPQVRKNILNDGGLTIAGKAYDEAHIITGRTRDSISIPILTDLMTRIEASFGAKWEERRGGRHALLLLGLQEFKRQAKTIIAKYFVENVTKGNANGSPNGGGKKARAGSYLRKWRNPQTGKWQYEYARNYSGGHGKRVGGFGTKRFPTST